MRRETAALAVKTGKLRHKDSVSYNTASRRRTRWWVNQALRSPSVRFLWYLNSLVCIVLQGGRSIHACLHRRCLALGLAAKKSFQLIHYYFRILNCNFIPCTTTESYCFLSQISRVGILRGKTPIRSILILLFFL